jgi:hypothetical protein
VFEVDTRTVSRGKKNEIPNKKVNLEAIFKVGSTVVSEKFDYISDLTINTTTNIISYDVYINNDYYGTDVNLIQVNTNDVVRFEIQKDNPSLESNINIISTLI